MVWCDVMGVGTSPPKPKTKKYVNCTGRWCCYVPLVSVFLLVLCVVSPCCSLLCVRRPGFSQVVLLWLIRVQAKNKPKIGSLWSHVEQWCAVFVPQNRCTRAGDLSPSVQCSHPLFVCCVYGWTVCLSLSLCICLHLPFLLS